MPNYNEIPISVNWHLWPKCNYACSFCFQTSPDAQSPIGLPDSRRVIRALAEAGTQKLTFVGGEPTLCPYLLDLIAETAACGIVPCIVTNASLLSRELLAQYRHVGLTWLGVSIDSFDERTQRELGRGPGNHVRKATKALEDARAEGIRTKINTVITSKNWNEDMREHIRALGPDRWKVFQVLHIEGENDANFHQLATTPDEYAAFVARHADLISAPENNAAMRGTYLMLDPKGRFFQNWQGRYVYGPSILDVGVHDALAATGWDYDGANARGAVYDWQARRVDTLV